MAVNLFWQSFAIGLVILLGGCIPQTEVPIASPAASPTAASPIQSSPARPTAAPVAPGSKTKTVTISVEGEPTQIKLRRVDDPDFATYVPEEFVKDSGASGGGRGMTFYFDPTNVMDKKASVRIFFPNQAEGVKPAQTPLSWEAYITATLRSYSESNGWEMLDRNNSPAYAWAQTAVNYRKLGQAPIAGTIYLGEQQGRRFRVITTFPLEYADGFLPRANVILENLNLR